MVVGEDGDFGRRKEVVAGKKSRIASVAVTGGRVPCFLCSLGLPERCPCDLRRKLSNSAELLPRWHKTAIEGLSWSSLVKNKEVGLVKSHVKTIPSPPTKRNRYQSVARNACV